MGIGDAEVVEGERGIGRPMQEGNRRMPAGRLHRPHRPHRRREAAQRGAPRAEAAAVDGAASQAVDVQAVAPREAHSRRGRQARQARAAVAPVLALPVARRRPAPLEALRAPRAASRGATSRPAGSRLPAPRLRPLPGQPTLRRVVSAGRRPPTRRGRPSVSVTSSLFARLRTHVRLPQQALPAPRAARVLPVAPKAAEDSPPGLPAPTTHSP
jgi:hypothetical protein